MTNLPHSLPLTSTDDDFMLPRHEWYPVARSAKVTATPQRVELLATPLVVFRSSVGKPVAWLDRCPHRNAPLSAGRCDEAGHLECPYHGWKFDSEGRCVEIPGRLGRLDKEYRTQDLMVREEFGLVWVCPARSKREPGRLPYRPPHLEDANYTTVVREVSAPGSLEAVTENALDVPHTAVLHRGLFRGGQRQKIRGVVRRYRRRVETEYIGERPPSGLVAKILALGGEEGELTVQHWDRFFAPNVLQVEYRLGTSTHFVISGFLLPERPQRTRLFAVASFRTPIPGRLLALALEPVGRLVFAQDQRMLAKQSEIVRRFGEERFISTELDTMGPAVHRLLKEATDAERRLEQSDEAGRELAQPARVGQLTEGEEPLQISELELGA